MNKQYLLNNLWWGENSRERNRAELESWSLTAPLASPDKSRIWGTDHSPWDGNVNMAVVRANGASFTIIKCMDGTVGSRYWLENRQRAIAAGLMVGDYSWLYPNNRVNCKAQAAAVWNRIKDQPKQLGLMVDFEWTRYMGQVANPTYSDLDIFVTEFIRLSGYKPILYSAAGYMNPLGAMPKVLKDKFSAICIANYEASAPALPFGYSSWEFWQFACTGDATVISPNDAGKLEVDLIYWHSNLDSLLKFAGMGDVILLPIPPIGGTMKGTVKSIVTTSLNVRTAAGSVIAALRYDRTLNKGDAVYGVVRSDDRIYFSKIYRASGIVQSLGQECSSITREGTSVWMDLIEVDEPTTPPIPEPEQPPALFPVSAEVVMSDGSKWNATGFQKSG